MAAGLGFKDFQTGEVLTAADVDGYLMQGVWVFASAAARDAAVTSPQEGNFAYLKDTNVTTYYTGSAWANLDTTGMVNPMTTTGDTIYSSSGSTPARLGIGSTGQVLTVSGGIPSWATPSSGGSYTLLSTTTLSGSSTTVSSINQTYTDLVIEVYGATWNTADDSCAFSTNLTLVLGAQKLTYSGVATIDNLSTTIFGLDDAVQNEKRTGGNNYFRFTFNNYSSTTDYKVWSLNASYEGASNNGRMVNIFGGAASDTAIDSFTFRTGNSYTLTAGTIKVYGVK